MAGIALVEVAQHVLVVVRRAEFNSAARAYLLATNVHRNIALKLLDALQLQ